MRSFEKVEIECDPSRQGGVVYVGTLPTVDAAGCELPFIQFEVSLARYLAERAGIRASEPIGLLLNDAPFFTAVAAQLAERGIQ